MVCATQLVLLLRFLASTLQTVTVHKTQTVMETAPAQTTSAHLNTTARSTHNHAPTITIAVQRTVNKEHVNPPALDKLIRHLASSQMEPAHALSMKNALPDSATAPKQLEYVPHNASPQAMLELTTPMDVSVPRTLNATLNSATQR